MSMNDRCKVTAHVTTNEMKVHSIIKEEAIFDDRLIGDVFNHSALAVSVSFTSILSMITLSTPSEIIVSIFPFNEVY